MNKFEFIKKQIPAKEVVKSLLGEPQKISGDSYIWSSPFRDGDTDPSFSANDVSVTDFGGEFKGDIFKFISEYCGVSPKDALDYIVKEFNVDTSMFINNNQITEITKNTNKQYKYILVKSEETPEEIFAMFDIVQYSQKPKGDELGAIKNRIAKSQPQIYKLEDVKKSVISGQTCIPAGIKSQADWIDNNNFFQIFMVDVDNVITVNGEKVKLLADDNRHITVEKIVNYCESINLQPTFIYYTFSHSENQHKFRLVYILEQGIQQQEVVKGIYEHLKNTFKDYNIDTSPTLISSMFLGGQSIAYESNIFYKVAEVEEETSIATIDNSEIELCSQMLKRTNYFIGDGMVWTKKKDGLVPISNFVVLLPEKINFKNGREIQTFYKAKCIVLDNPDINLPTEIIDVETLKKFDFGLGSSWDKYAIISAGSSNTDKLREITQIISRGIMTEKDIYSHTGFTEIDGKLCYLGHGVVIGDVENVEVDISTDKLQQYCFTDKTFDIKEALECSFSILDVADREVTIPLLAVAFLAIITSILAEEGINADFILFLEGKSGTRKSSLAALILSFFGKFTRDTFPCSFRDTINSIEKKAFLLKDTLNVVDDFNPEMVGNRKLDTMERLYAMYGDRTGRTRMSQDGKTLKAPYVARGLCLVTGETTPDVAQSRIARSLIVPMKQDSVDLKKLSILQNNTEKLSFCMIIYIKWIIQNENEVRQFVKSRFDELRENQNNQHHGRTTEICNVLTLGFNLFTKFMMDNKIIEKEEKEKLDIEAINVLDKLVEQQAENLIELKPTEMFNDAIEQLFATNSIQVLDYHCGATAEPISEGGINVGFYDSNKKIFYFYPDIIYGVVAKFYSNNGKKFPINAKSLWKYLLEEEQLIRTDPNRYTVQRKVNGKAITVVAIKPREKECTGDVEEVKWNRLDSIWGPKFFKDNTF